MSFRSLFNLFLLWIFVFKKVRRMWLKSTAFRNNKHSETNTQKKIYGAKEISWSFDTWMNCVTKDYSESRALIQVDVQDTIDTGIRLGS